MQGVRPVAAAPGPPAAALPRLGPPQPIVRPVAPATPAAQAQFLTRAFGPRKLGFGTIANWTGNKILGAGTYGVVALWEFTGAFAARPPIHTKVAVKSALSAANELTKEGQFSQYLAPGRPPLTPPHLVELIKNPPQIVSSGVFNGLTRRLIFEYCSQGSLHNLLNMRMARLVLPLIYHYITITKGCN